MSHEGDHVLCEQCGAPMPLIGTDSLRCPFCLHRQAPPPELAHVLRERAALAEAYEGALAKAESATARLQTGVSLYVLGIGAFAGLGVLGVGGFAVLQLMDGDPKGVFGLFAIVLFAAMVGTVIRAHLKSQRYAESLRMAQLPCAKTAFVGDALRAACPQCGADTEARTITPICGHCQTAFLLPLPLVDQAHRRVHREIIEIRSSGAPKNATDIAMAANAQYQKTVRKMIPIFSVIFFIGLAAWLAYVETTQP